MQNDIWEICDDNSKKIKTPPTQINHLLLIKHVQIISPNYIFFKINACKPIFNSTEGLGTNNRWIVVISTIQEIFIPRNCILVIEKELSGSCACTPIVSHVEWQHTCLDLLCSHSRKLQVDSLLAGPHPKKLYLLLQSWTIICRTWSLTFFLLCSYFYSTFDGH